MKTDVARPYIDKEMEMKDRLGPYQYRLYLRRRELDMESGRDGPA